MEWSEEIEASFFVYRPLSPCFPILPSVLTINIWTMRCILGIATGVHAHSLNMLLRS